jgi:hypothetical protein
MDAELSSAVGAVNALNRKAMRRIIRDVPHFLISHRFNASNPSDK